MKESMIYCKDGLSTKLNIPQEVKQVIEQVSGRYRFQASKYYLSLIDWDNPEDPIRRLIVPDLSELDEWGSADPSGEANYTIMPGLEHKYPSTALLLVSNICGGICRYCFRKRVFIEDEVIQNIDSAIEYIQQHKEITNILLTGGDPLMLSNARIEHLLNKLKEIKHVKIIRFGSKMLAFNPMRVIDDPNLLNIFKDHIDNTHQQIYLMNHFSHPNEISELAVKAVKMIRSANVVLTNQNPIICGVNDNSDDLAKLFVTLSEIGVPPYYVFQCRPAMGNKGFAVPLEQGYRIFEEACSKVSGLAKRARFVMSHRTGKIEIVGVHEGEVYFKYHRAASLDNSSSFLVLKSNPGAYWLDDYEGLESFNLE